MLNQNLKNRMWIAAGLMTALTAGSVALAGGESSGGGNVVIMPDNSVVISDLFHTDEAPGDDSFLPDEKEINTELQNLNSILVAYGAEKTSAQDESGNSIAKVVMEQVFNPLVDFRVTDKLPTKPGCNPLIPDGLPQGAQVERVACTEGWITWFKLDLFKRLSSRHKVLVLFHERLHSLPHPVSHEHIVDLVRALDTALKLKAEQDRGIHRHLTDAEMSMMRLIPKRISQLGLRKTDFDSVAEISAYDIQRNGGGLLTMASIWKSEAFIGIGSKVWAQSRIDDEAVIINSVCMSCSIKSKARITNSRISAPLGSSIEIGENVIIENAQIENTRFKARDFTIIENVKIFNAEEVRLDRNSNLKNLKLAFEPVDGNKPGSLHLAEDTYLVNFGKDEQLTIKSIATESVLKVATGSYIDFENNSKVVCNGYSPQIKIQSETVVSSVSEVAALCKY